ncbi:hypothetical protein GCM10007880_53620 [Mesorhizobium amorphae]|nr:hypothetical protein GCM10007880_53620 [Mesorhizobium amorphae]
MGKAAPGLVTGTKATFSGKGLSPSLITVDGSEEADVACIDESAAVAVVALEAALMSAEVAL